MSILHDPKLERLLSRSHARSVEQREAMRVHAATESDPALIKAFRSDKLVALDRDKAEFCYQLCRANNARRIVEIGTSYGVSTLYLAAAVRENLRAGGGEGVVIGDGPVDFVLVDIWISMARAALEMVAPHLRSGAIVVCDNAEQYRRDYADYFAFINDPANGFRSMTLPFDGGLEFSVRC